MVGEEKGDGGALSSEVRNVGVCSRNNRVAGSAIKCAGVFWFRFWDLHLRHKNNGRKVRFDLEYPITESNRIEICL